jgi:hypothetical protein
MFNPGRHVADRSTDILARWPYVLTGTGQNNELLEWAPLINLEGRLAKVIDVEATAFDDTLESSNRNRLAPMHSNDHLTTIGMPSFLMTALLTDQ